MALATDYYVDGDTGSDSNAGTSGAPFLTLQKAFDTIDTESTSNLVTAASGVVTIHLVAGDCGTNETLAGITDNASNYILIKGTTHSTKVQWDTGSPFVQGSAGRGINNDINFTRIENVQVLIADTVGSEGIRSTGSDTLIDSCIIRGQDPSVGSNRLYGIRVNNASSTMNIRNCVVYGIFTSTGGVYSRDFHSDNAGGTVLFHNCFAIENSTLSFAYGFKNDGNTVTVTNAYSSGISNFSGITTLTTSAANDTEGTSANLDNIALTTTNFVDPLNATTTSRDFTLVSGTKLEDGTESTDLSGTFTTDWFGNTIVTWPIGPAELVAVGGASGKSNPLHGPLGGPLAGVL